MILSSSFLSVLTYVFYIFIAVLAILVMILVHELGHYIVGKALKFKILEFSIGFGPKIFQRQNKSGEYITLRLIPLGGYCSFDGEEEDSESQYSFSKQHPFKRILVLISGALMNFLFAILIIIIMLGAYGQSLLVVTNPIESTQIESQYRFNKNDVIIKIDGKNVYMPTDVITKLDGITVEESNETPITFTVLRNGKSENIQIKLCQNANFSNLEDVETLFSSLGIAENGLKYTNIKFGFFETIGRSFEYSGRMATTIFTIVNQLFTGRLGVSALGGTFTVISTTASLLQSSGIFYLLQIMALIGVNLAIFNLIPFPALDGCQVLFTVIEWIRKRPINKKVQTIINSVGLIILLLFAIFVDVQHLF